MRLLGNWARVASEIGQVHSNIQAMMVKLADATREALVILAREASQGQQQGGLPTRDATVKQQPPTASYPPQGTF
jgi:hypothetical protein